MPAEIQNRMERLLSHAFFKKAIATIIAIVMFDVSVIAQLDKGTWLVGGNASFTTANLEPLDGTRTGNSTLVLAPAAGYFLADRFAAGLRITGSNHHTTAPGGTLFPPTKTNILTVYAGPFSRYYFLKPGARNLFNLFTEVAYAPGFFIRSYKDDRPSEKQSLSQFSVAVGPVIYFNSSVGLEFTVGYYKTNNTTLEFQSPGGFQASLGFQVHLGKDKQ